MQIGVWGASESSHRAWWLCSIYWRFVFDLAGWDGWSQGFEYSLETSNKLRVCYMRIRILSKCAIAAILSLVFWRYFCNKDTDHKYYTSFFAGLVFEKRKRGDRRQIDLTEAVSNFTVLANVIFSRLWSLLAWSIIIPRIHRWSWHSRWLHH